VTLRYTFGMAVASEVTQDDAYNRIIQILGCKWSLGILDALERGVNRPGKIEKDLQGISTKVLHRCMNRLEGDGIIQKQVFAEVPPRVEYSVTATGHEMLKLLSQVRSIAGTWTGAGPY